MTTYTAEQYAALNDKVQHLRQQNANLQDLVDSNLDPDQVPLLRRVIMQRREIRAAWQTSNMYQRMWRAAASKLGKDWKQSPESVIERALSTLNDSSVKSTERVRIAKEILEGTR
jgi:predicted Holliday junction resolvase-like endonuclease